MKSMKIAFLCFLFVAVATSSTAEKFSQVRIFATSASDFKRITNAGLFIDHANTKQGYYSDAWLSESEIELLRKSGVRFEILIDDWDAYYNTLPKMTQAEKDAAIRQSAQESNVSHSIYGSMGGYLTYVEVVAKLDSMRVEYPNFISPKFSIGTTIEGRTMWAVRITKNPEAPTGKPEVLYHALIHAREPESMETQMYYFYWLFENYGTDPIATYILDNREIYWLPVFNVDGYVYNQTTNPNGGGMWRANRHNTGSNCGYVDLNRNFGIYQFWNSSNGGSSENACSGGSGTYRGPSPFSEPETQAIMNFVNSRNFNAAFAAHTYGNYLIKPWAWSDPTPTPDDTKFNQFLADMKASNPVYTTGTPSQTVGYEVRGGSDDWYYNDSAHVGHHIFGITPETGASFWPAQNQIIPLAQGMLFNNQYMSLIAGPYVNPLSKTFNQQTYTPGQSGTYKLVLRNKGALAANNVKVTWTSANSAITIPPAEFTYPSLASFATDSSVFAFTLSASVPNNSAIPTLLTITLDTTTVYSSVAYVVVGNGALVFNDDGNTFANWTTDGQWAVTASQSHSAPSSFTDSPSGSYGNNTDKSMILASPLNAATSPVMILDFYHKYATEENYDFCNVEVSNDNGTTWQSVASYDGTLSAWARQTFDITSYVSASPQVKIRFRLTSDLSLTADGWYVDDVRVNGYTIPVAPPDTGIVVFPQSFTFNGTTGRVFRDSLKIKNFTGASVSLTLAESTVTTTNLTSTIVGDGKEANMQTLIDRLRPAFRSANLTRESFGGTPNGAPSSPDVYTTILADDRGESAGGAADIFRVEYQYRTSFLGNFHDFKIVMGLLPDTNVAIVLSVDTDQDFGTGRFPTPLGAGPTSRDIGSEREIVIDASGILIDSLTGLGRIPAGAVLDVSQDSITIVGLPFFLNVRTDSVLTISTETVTGGINENALADPDRKMNIGLLATHIERSANPLPDFAPVIGHANIGGETGVSWFTEDTTHVTIASNDSATIRISALAAKPAGIYHANIALLALGRGPLNIPVTMNVTQAPSPQIQVSPTAFRDTLVVGDSVTNILVIHNNGGGTLNYVVLDTAATAWLSIDPLVGSVDSGLTSTASLTVQTAGLVGDTTYFIPLLVLSNDPNAAVVPVDLMVTVRRLTAMHESGIIPTTYALRQNYPNPFNPETNISFDLPKNSLVTLRVFNLLGQEVATIVNSQLEAGTHSYKVGGDRFGLASGVYLFRMSAEDFVQTKKMILMK